MSAFPGSPRLVKGALVEVDRQGGRRVHAFQYNPDTLTRRLEPRTATQEGGGQAEMTGFSGPPRELISLSLEIDASTDLEQGKSGALATGIHQQLAELEVLLYPKAADIQKGVSLAASGQLEIIPAESPLTLLVMGEQRVVPVRITSLAVVEEAYDARLNPIRAKVDLSFAVISSADVTAHHGAFSRYMAHQSAKESLASKVNPGG